MVGAEPGFLKRQCLFVELEGVGVPPKAAIIHGQVVHAAERVGMVGAELAFLECQRLFAELEGFGKPPDFVVADRQQTHARERENMVRAEMLGVKRASTRELLDGDLRLTQEPEGPAQGHPEPGLYQWLVGETL